MATSREQLFYALTIISTIAICALVPSWSLYTIALAAVLGVTEILFGTFSGADKAHAATAKEMAEAVADNAKANARVAKSQAVLAKENMLGAVGVVGGGGNPLGGVLRPGEFQEFRLSEKRVVSWNTAMYVLLVSLLLPSSSSPILLDPSSPRQETLHQ